MIDEGKDIANPENREGMTLKEAQKRAAQALAKASTNNTHFMLLTGEVLGDSVDMGHAVNASPEVLSELLLSTMQESDHMRRAVMMAVHKFRKQRPTK